MLHYGNVPKECWGEDDGFKKPKRSQIADLQANRRTARRRAEGWARSQQLLDQSFKTNPESRLEAAEYIAQQLNEHIGYEKFSWKELMPILTQYSNLDSDAVQDIVLSFKELLPVNNGNIKKVVNGTREAAKSVTIIDKSQQRNTDRLRYGGSSIRERATETVIDDDRTHRRREFKGDGRIEREWMGRGKHNTRPRA